jgi:hypothetical protein
VQHVRSLIGATIATTVLLVPTTAGAATVHLSVPGLSGPSKAEIGFTVARSWVPARDEVRGTPVVGGYERRVALDGGGTCILSLDVHGVTVHQRPTLDDAGWLNISDSADLLPRRVEVARHGRRGPLRWYAGPGVRPRERGAGPLTPVRGDAVLRAPGWATTPTRPFAVAHVLLDAAVVPAHPPGTEAETAACHDAARSRFAPLLIPLLRSVRVRRRS